MGETMSEYKMTMPQEVVRIINTLEEHGYEAYAVGGCVRDAMLGRTPEDWDITTSAKPLEVKALFRKTIDTGLQHGTITVRAMRSRPTGSMVSTRTAGIRRRWHLQRT